MEGSNGNALPRQNQLYGVPPRKRVEFNSAARNKAKRNELEFMKLLRKREKQRHQQGFWDELLFWSVFFLSIASFVTMLVLTTKWYRDQRARLAWTWYGWAICFMVSWWYVWRRVFKRS